MTPFAVSSSPATNVIWGWINLIVGIALWMAFVTDARAAEVWIAFGLGGFVVSFGLAIFWTNPEARLPWHRD